MSDDHMEVNEIGVNKQHIQSDKNINNIQQIEKNDGSSNLNVKSTGGILFKLIKTGGGIAKQQLKEIFKKDYTQRNQRKKVSTNISKALFYGKKKGSKIVAILGRNDGDAFRLSNNKLVIPTIDKNLITPMSESFQSLLWHLIVSHPLLVPNKTKW
jgi:hypothetical protein